MQKNNGEKTESGRNTRFALLVAGILVLILCVVETVVFATKSQPKPDFAINNRALTIERVNTPEALTKGLSGRDSLEPNTGMLFEFDNSYKHCFWMKDMNFPIDMLWLNEQKQIVHIEPNAQPDSYPKTFCPPEDAKYVLEVNAGKTAEWGWAVDDQATFL